MFKLSLLLITLCTLISCSRDIEKSNRNLSEGIPYLKKGDYEGALIRFEKSLEADDKNLIAKICKAESLYLLEMYDETIFICKSIISEYPDTSYLQKIYLIYGLSLKEQNKKNESIQIFENASNKFPKNSNLYYNLGLLYQEKDSTNKAISYFEKTLLYNWQHNYASYDLAKLLLKEERTIPAIMSLTLAIINNPNTFQNDSCLKDLNGILNNLIDSNKISKNMSNPYKEIDNFESVEKSLIQAILSDENKKYYKLNEIGSMSKYIKSICSEMKTNKISNDNFYWKYFADYFIGMLDSNYTETVAHIVFSSTDDLLNKDWLDNNRESVLTFYDWHKNYEVK